MMDLPPAIETRGLSKRYKSAHALRGLDLRVPAGSIYGLVGRNGAGKTLMGLFTFIVDDFTPYSIFRLMNGAEYFFNHRVPWSGLAVSATMGMAFIWLSMRIVEARDY
jgi:ABC-type branched-subunit amino acid transport system ATPase component